MGIRYYEDVVQGSEEWLRARLGVLTASEMKQIMTPSMKPARNEKERSHLWELCAQRISGFVEPTYVNDDMLRGRDDEIVARALYSETYAEVREVGFVTNDQWGFTLGYSPDGLVGDEGLIEVKSRRQKFQIETICNGEMPVDYLLQVQTGLLVTDRAWCDFISYSGGLPMVTYRVWPNEEIQGAIIDASAEFERRIKEILKRYQDVTAEVAKRFIQTERTIELEIVV
jgi:predicted phage-related endonuclease